VDDLVEGFLALVGRREALGKTYHFAGGGSLSLKEMAEALLAHMGRRKRVLGVPLALAYVPAAAAWAYGRVSGRPHDLTVQSLTGLCQDAVPEDPEASRDLGWRPRSFREGLATLRSLEGCLAR
jgi:nucleoside-diphosphate-sugar epimerase